MKTTTFKPNLYFYHRIPLRYDWTIYKEFIPKPSKTPTAAKTREPRPGLIPTQPLNDSDTENICIISGIKDAPDSAKLAEKIAQIFDEADLALVSNISTAKNGCGVLTCCDKPAAVKLAKKYNDRQFDGGKISLQTFAASK